APWSEGTRHPTDELCKLQSAFGRSVAHAKIDYSTRKERTRRALARFSGTDHQNFPLRQVPEDFLREIDSHRSDRYRATRDFSVGSNLLGHSKRALKQSMQNRSGRPSCARGFVGLLYLAKNFRLAHDHGIDSGSDSEQMLHAFHIFVAIERRRLVVRKILVDLARETAGDFFSRDALLRCGVNFHAITRRQEQRFCSTRG